jgi:hypothetical protein
MKRLFLLAAVLAAAAALAAPVQEMPGQPAISSPGADAGQKPDPKASPNIAGKWIMTLEMSMGTATPTLELKQEGDKVTGTYTGRYGTFPLQGTLSGTALVFSFTMTAEGESVDMSFTGEVAADAQTMKGNASLAGMGEASWSAKRDKAAGK